MQGILSFVGLYGKERRMLRKSSDIRATVLPFHPEASQNGIASTQEKEVEAQFNEMQQARMAIAKAVKSQIQSTVSVERRKRVITRGDGKGRTGVMHVKTVKSFIEQDGQEVSISKMEEKYMMGNLTEFLQSQDASAWQGDGVKKVELYTGVESKVLISLQIEQVRSYLEAKGIWLERKNEFQSYIDPVYTLVHDVIAEESVNKTFTIGRQPEKNPLRKDVPLDLRLDFSRSLLERFPASEITKSLILREYTLYIQSHPEPFLKAFLEANGFDMSYAFFIMKTCSESDITRALKMYFSVSGKIVGKQTLDHFASEARNQMTSSRLPKECLSNMEIFARQLRNIDLGVGGQVLLDYAHDLFEYYRQESFCYLQMCVSTNRTWREAGVKGFKGLIDGISIQKQGRSLQAAQ